ncbi:MAG: ATP-binding protein [Phycisphaerae bacterium]|nr:ATP-binding protein [Phycisphaerae bacterium]
MLTGIKDKSAKTVCPVHTPLESLGQIIAQVENNTLRLDLSAFESLVLLKEIRDYYDTSCLSQDKLIALDGTSQSVQMVSDRRLLTHVIRQMIANAVEASPMGQTVHIGCLADHNHCTFWVINEAVIPEFVQDNMFVRDFSTKSQTRGLGTYSIKLLSEKYLKGRTTFTSKANQGTVFRATFPLVISATNATK